MRDNTTMSRPKKRPIVVKERHRAVARELKRQAIESDYRPIDETLEKIGKYKPSVARHRQKNVMSSPSMQKALELEGISQKQADTAIKSILSAPIYDFEITPDHIIRSAEYISKRLGGYAPDKHISVSGTLSELLGNIKEDDK